MLETSNRVLEHLGAMVNMASDVQVLEQARTGLDPGGERINMDILDQVGERRRRGTRAHVRPRA